MKDRYHEESGWPLFNILGLDSESSDSDDSIWESSTAETLPVYTPINSEEAAEEPQVDQDTVPSTAVTDDPQAPRRHKACFWIELILEHGPETAYVAFTMSITAWAGGITIRPKDLFSQSPVMCNFVGLLWGFFFAWWMHDRGMVREVEPSLERRLELFWISIVRRMKTVIYVAVSSLMFAIVSIAFGGNGCIAECPV